MARYVLAAVLFCQVSVPLPLFSSNFFGVFHQKLEILDMPSVEGEENGEEEVERSPNEDENMSEDEDEESSLSSDESSSESSSQCFQFSALFFSSHNFVCLPVSFSMVLMILFYLVDETENERRRNECLNDMADLERQFSDLKEQLV